MAKLNIEAEGQFNNRDSQYRLRDRKRYASKVKNGYSDIKI